MKNIMSVLVAFIFLATVPVEAQKKKDKEPELKNWDSYDFSDHFSIKFFGGKKEFKDNKRVFINDFVISQVVLANGKATNASQFAKVTVNMSPIDMTAYQDLVAKAYKSFVASLKAEGYEIVSDQEVENSDFAKKEHNGKSVNFWYADEIPLTDKDQFGNEMVKIRPVGKYTVTNSKIGGTWSAKFARAINANVISVNLIVNFVGFDGSRHTGYRRGPSVSASPYLYVQPWFMGNNEKGGLMVTTKLVEGNNQWVGPKGLEETSQNTNYFGSAKGKYVMDVNQDEYLSEVGAITHGLSRAFVTAMVNEVK